MTIQPDTTQLVEILPEPVLLFEPKNLALTWMNLAAENWLRCSLASKRGTALANIADGFAPLEAAVRATVANGATIRGYDLRVDILGRDLIDRSYLVFPFADGVAVMLSPQRSGGEIEDDSHKGKAVSMFGRMLAHELKNPLAGIYGAVQLLEAAISDEDNLEITALIKSEVKRIGRLADKMEDFGESTAAEFTSCNIHTVLRKALLLFQNAENAGVEFVENYDPSLPDVYGNADKLMQVVINLLANAADAVKAGRPTGKVEIQTVYRAGVRKKAPWGDVQALNVEVKIIDNGGGIPAHLKDSIFQPFVTGKNNGQGLGLALVSKIIDEHGGLVACKSKADKTVFSILLPSFHGENA